MLTHVFSGGQTGADQAGLAAAKEVGLATGGWAPRGYLTLVGPNLSLGWLFGLQEHAGSYGPRTDANVRDTDGTIRLAGDFGSPGERRTLRAIRRFNKPHLDVDVRQRPYFPQEEVVAWLRRHEIVVLNVAGNSEETWPGIYNFAHEYLKMVFLRSLGRV